MMKGMAIAMFCAVLAGPALCEDRVFQEDVPAAGRLRVDLEVGGSIRIEGGNGATISVKAVYNGRDAADVRFSVEAKGDEVVVRSEYEGKRARRQTGGEVTIRVPSSIDLDLRTTGGELTIRDVEGVLIAETMGGQVTLEQLRGRLDVRTMGGNIRLERSEVSGRVETMGGHIGLADICGSVETSTMGGNVTYRNVDESCGGECRPVKITTMGGNVSAPDAPCGADLETMGGNVRIARAADHVKARTMGGDISIGEVDGWVHATTAGGRIDVKLVGESGRHDVRLESAAGNVTLRIPAGLSVDVDVTVFLTRHGRQDYKVKSDVQLDLRRDENWDYDFSPPRKAIRARGRSGDGAHRIRIETVDGDVVLIRE